MAEQQNYTPGSTVVTNPPNTADEGGFNSVVVKRTVGGHQEIIDNTLGNERLIRQHASGTKEELTTEGNRQLIVQGEEHKVIHEGNTVEISGKCVIIINSKCEVKVTQGVEVNVDSGGVNWNVQQGDFNINLNGGNFNVNSRAGDICLNTARDFKVDATSNTDIKSGNDHSHNSKTFHSNVTAMYDSKFGTGAFDATTGGLFLTSASGPTQFVADNFRVVSDGEAHFSSSNFRFTKGELFQEKKTWLQDELDVKGAQKNHSTLNVEGRITGQSDVFGPSVSLETHIHPYGGVHGSSTGGPA